MTPWDRYVRPRWRLLRRRTRGRGLLHCNLCGWQGGFLQRGPDPAQRHCPRCKSANRHRLILWYLEHASLLRPATQVLHVAPEAALAARLQQGRHYESCDLIRADVDHRLDLQSAIVAADRYDLIVINHVLEHVPDDRAVLGNLRRMLAPGGLCLITVPMRPSGGATDEELGPLSPQARRARFGQDDHLRLYGLDLLDRMATAGLQVSLFTSAEADQRAVSRHSMQDETLFLGRRP
jgi:SAM-dependent methyltransferase